jgi:acetoin utilization protein AcuB
MTFIIQGLTGHEVMPLEKLFKPVGVTKTEAIVAEHPIDEKEHHDAEKHVQQAVVEQAYRTVDQLPQVDAVLFAERIMSSPVVTLTPQATLEQALTLFQKSQFRHIPVVSAARRLVGILSDRDILRDVGGFKENYQPQVPHKLNDRVELLMKTPVLTASQDTDVRHIARLFVAQHVGAMPIVREGELIGIITRNDILKAVMSNFVLELWA